MSETTWNEDAIRRWARNELRAPADSDCYARANAILYALVSLRDARESAAHNAHENEHLRMTLGVYEPEALAWRRIAEALGMVQFADGHPPGYPEPHEVFAAVIALRDGAKVSALRANKLTSEYREGEWCLPSEYEAQAYVTHTAEPSPETGHVGWCWWALGDMGDAPTYEDAKAAAEARVRQVAAASTDDLQPIRNPPPGAASPRRNST